MEASSFRSFVESLLGIDFVDPLQSVEKEKDSALSLLILISLFLPLLCSILLVKLP